MKPGDIETVVEIDRLSFPTAWTKESYLRDLANPRCCYLVIEEDKSIIGFGGMWVISDECHITTLAIHPLRRNRGLAGRLLEEMIRQAKKRGAGMMTLEVRLGNEAARRLYECYGFAIIAQVRNYYPDTEEDALVMRLNPLELRRQPQARP
jgi:ribosomal-protein-alanine N-acetyltransferase